MHTSGRRSDHHPYAPSELTWLCHARLRLLGPRPRAHPPGALGGSADLVPGQPPGEEPHRHRARGALLVDLSDREAPSSRSDPSPGSMGHDRGRPASTTFDPWTTSSGVPRRVEPARAGRPGAARHRVDGRASSSRPLPALGGAPHRRRPARLAVRARTDDGRTGGRAVRRTASTRRSTWTSTGSGRTCSAKRSVSRGRSRRATHPGRPRRTSLAGSRRDDPACRCYVRVPARRSRTGDSRCAS